MGAQEKLHELQQDYLALDRKREDLQFEVYCFRFTTVLLFLVIFGLLLWR